MVAQLGEFSSQAHSQETAAQQPEPEPSVAVSVNPGGVQRFAQGRWASLSVVASNPTTSDSTEVVSVYLDDDPSLQFSTKLWVPAQSVHQTWLPIRVPENKKNRSGRVKMSVMRVQASNGNESFGDADNGLSIRERSLMLANREINTGISSYIPDRNFDRDRPEKKELLHHLVAVGRDTVITTDLDLPAVGFNSNFLPASYGAFDELDQLLVAGDNLNGDSQGIASVRQWIRNGGRLWIMLDMTSEDLVAELLGSDVRHTRIDRIELNDFEMISTAPLGGGEDIGSETWSSEEPVEMVRVVCDVDDNDVRSRIDGWPAAFWVRVGDGEVLLTTVGARGWLKKDGSVTRAYHQLSRNFFEPKNEPTDFQEKLQPLVDDRIGYTIPSRGLAALILGINAIVILAAGVWWARQRRLERMAILVPASAILTTLTMLWVGNRHTQSVPSMVATSQVVQVRSGTAEADASTTRAIYSQSSEGLELRASSSSIPMPLAEEVDSQTRRLRLNDDGFSRWEGANQPPGVVRHLTSSATMPLTEPIRVIGTFGKDGFEGIVEGMDPARCSDGTIVAQHCPATAASLQQSGNVPGQIIAPVTALLPPGQFVPGTLLSDEERKRQDFLASVLQSSETSSLDRNLSFLTWTDPFDMGVQFADRFEQVGTALVSMPISITQPAAGTEFRIPTTFIRTEPAASTGGVSILYNPRTGKWLEELTKESEAQLNFRFPSEVASMKLRNVHVRMKASAPSRTLYVKAMVNGKAETIYEKRDPTGLVEFDIKRPDALQLRDNGGLWLAFGVSASDTAIENRKKQEEIEGGPAAIAGPSSDSTTWQIEYVHLDAVGHIEPNTNTANLASSKADIQ